MKILMVEQFLPDSVYTLELCRALRRQQDMQLTVFCRKGGPVPLDGVQWKDAFYAGGKGRAEAVLRYGAGLAALAREMRTGGYDVIHVQNFKDARYEIPLYCRAKKHCGLLVHTVHNLLPHEAVERDKKLYGALYASCDLLVVHNLYCRQLLLDEYHVPPEKICVTPHGSYTQIHVEASVFPHAGTAEFLQFGVLRRYKGVDILLEALARMTDAQRSRVHVTIAGAQYPKLDATDYAAIIRQKQLSSCVTLRLGHVPETELDGLYRSADFCLFPYREIYGSGALLMAYSYAKPVLASGIPAFEEETSGGAAGMLYPPEDPDALKAAMLQAADWQAAEYAARQKCIRTLVQEKYNWTHSAECLAKGYHDVWQRKQAT